MHLQGGFKLGRAHSAARFFQQLGVQPATLRHLLQPFGYLLWRTASLTVLPHLNAYCLASCLALGNAFGLALALALAAALDAACALAFAFAFAFALPFAFGTEGTPGFPLVVFASFLAAFRVSNNEVKPPFAEIFAAAGVGPS